MSLHEKRTAISGVLLTLALAACPAAAEAALLTHWFGPESAVYRPVYTTTAYPTVAAYGSCNTCTPAVAYRPVAVASSCNTCAPAPLLTPRRMAFRPVAAYAPVTTLRPVAACNSCGTQTITMRPVTTYVYRRSYRPMFAGRACSSCTPVYAARPVVTSGCTTGVCSAGGCSTGACGVPTITNYAPMATVSSGCCGATTSPSTTTIVSPATAYSSTATPAASTYSTPTPTYAAPTPAAKQPASGTPQPDLKSTYEVDPSKKTFKKEPTIEEKVEDDGALQPIPQSSGKSSGAGTSIFRKPKIADPRDRTAKVFVPRWNVQQATHVQPVKEPQRELRTDGWSAPR